MRSRLTGWSLLLVLLPLVACSDDQGAATGEAQVFLSRSSSGQSAALAAGVLASSQFAPISLSDVDAITVRITAVEAVAPNEGFVTLQVQGEAGQEINLKALPIEGQGDPILLARGEVTAGTYNNVRLRFDEASATITLNREVTVGPRTFAAGVHPLTIPSGAQTGVKVPTAGFTVPDDGSDSVTLIFDANTSVHNVTATGAGTIIMNPSLTARGE